MEKIHINPNLIKDAKNKIPKEDFINKKYDNKGYVINELLLIFSTPRSGSTFLCEYLYNRGFCLPHEYFQPDHYFPLLAERWSALDKNYLLNEKLFVEKLCTKRTFQTGVLGINLHAEHIPLFNRLIKHFPQKNNMYIFLERKNKIHQAVSYEIACQTNKWSSNFKKLCDPIYSFENIFKKLKRIYSQNTFIDAYLYFLGKNYIKIYYEDIIENEEMLLDIFNLHEIENICNKKNNNIKRQFSNINKEWIERFYQDYYVEKSEDYLPYKTKNNLKLKIFSKAIDLFMK